MKRAKLAYGAIFLGMLVLWTAGLLGRLSLVLPLMLLDAGQFGMSLLLLLSLLIFLDSRLIGSLIDVEIIDIS